MPSILNSDDGVVSGTSGLKTTGGNDGLLNIQSNGSTIVAVTGSGISVTGTVSQTGVSTFAAGTASAPSITFTGDTNTGIFSPAADTIAFTEGGAEAMRIDSSGNLLIGTTTTSGYSLGSVYNATTRNPGFVFQNSTTGQTDSDGLFVGIGLGGGADASSAYFYHRENGPAVFATNNTERMRINAGAPILCLSGGNTTATGTGIAFPATQSASSDANTLDDYEEGSFTPTVAFGITSPTYSTQSGFYTKIGNIYYWQMRLVVTGGTLNSSTLTIGGMPFTSSAGSGSNGVGLFSYVHSSIVNSTTTNPPTIYVPPSTTLLEFYNTAGASFGGTSLVSLPDFYLAGWIRT